MDFALGEDRSKLREEVRQFASEEIAPVAGELDRTETYPADLVDRAVERGLVGSHLPPEHGGLGHSALDLAIITEELFAVDPGIGLSITSASFGADVIRSYGSPAQRERYLDPIPAGQAVMGVAITEPESGSDVASVSTSAELSNGDWVINGQKRWITNGTIGEYFLVLCETDPDIEDRYAGFSLLLVEADRDGLEIEKLTGKLGMRASDSGAFVFDDVRVPEENLIGGRGMGFPQLMELFDQTRAIVAAQGVGIAAGAAREARAYAKSREQFDRPIAELQAIQHKLARMFTRTEAARWLAYRAAWAVDHQPEELTKLASMAKVQASEIATEVADQAVQIHGAAGILDDRPVARLYRDAKVTQIYEGTTEIQLNIIARELLDREWG